MRNRAVLDAVAGATAGCVARFVVGPLDVLKIRFQASMPRLDMVGRQPRSIVAENTAGITPAVPAHACKSPRALSGDSDVFVPQSAACTAIRSSLPACSLSTRAHNKKQRSLSRRLSTAMRHGRNTEEHGRSACAQPSVRI